MTRLNLSDWAIRHRSLVVYLMIILTARASALLRARAERGSGIHIKTMVVQAAWPGATIDDTLPQLTERIERN